MLNDRNKANEIERQAYSKPQLVPRGNILDITKGPGGDIALDGLGDGIGPGDES